MKNVIAIVAGVSIYFILTVSITILLNYFYPLSDGLDSRNKEDMIQHMASLPISALLFQLLGSALSIFCAVFIGLKLATSDYASIAVLITVVISFFGFGLLISFPHPWWFTLVALVLFPIFGYLGWKTFKRE